MAAAAAGQVMRKSMHQAEKREQSQFGSNSDWRTLSVHVWTKTACMLWNF
jgi:hypothetical protein